MSQPDIISDVISETHKRVLSVQERLGVTIRGSCGYCGRTGPLYDGDSCYDCLNNPPKPTDIFSLSWLADGLDKLLDELGL